MIALGMFLVTLAGVALGSWAMLKKIEIDRLNMSTAEKEIHTMASKYHYKVYLSAKFEYKETLLFVAAMLKAAGYDVVSRWIEEDKHKTEDNLTLAEREAIALRDYMQIEQCDIMVYFNIMKSGTGANREVGYAQGLGKKVFGIGNPSNSPFDYYNIAWLGDEITDLIPGLNKWAKL